MIETRTLCNGCPECHQCGGKFQKYKAIICDYCNGEVEKAVHHNGEHICMKCLGNVFEIVTEDDLNG